MNDVDLGTISNSPIHYILIYLHRETCGCLAEAFLQAPSRFTFYVSRSEIEVVSDEPQEVVEEDGALTFLSPATVDCVEVAP